MASRCPQRLSFSHLGQPFDLALGEMLPRPVYAVRLCALVSGWHHDCELFVVRSSTVRCAVAAISMSSGEPTVHLKLLLFAVVRSYSDLGILFPS